MEDIRHPFFSVVIPAYNQGRWAREAVESALNQGRRDVEVIAVNDGSTDNTGAVLAEYADRVKIIVQPNSGVSAARNRGIAEARGEWIAFLDADDRYRPGHLDRLFQAIQSCPEAGLVYADAMYIDEEGREVKAKRSPPLGENQFRSLLLNNAVTASASAAKKSALDRAGGFPPQLKAGEDWDLWLRIARNHRLVHVPAISIDYRWQRRGAIHTLGTRIRDDNLQTVARAAGWDPSLPPALLRKARANCYLASAIRLITALEIAAARKELEAALREDWKTPQAWLLFLLTLGGKPLAALAFRLRRNRKLTP